MSVFVWKASVWMASKAGRVNRRHDRRERPVGEANRMCPLPGTWKESAMLILDYDQSDETLTLDRLLWDWIQALRGRWVRLWAWLRRRPVASDKVDRQVAESDRGASLIL